MKIPSWLICLGMLLSQDLEANLRNPFVKPLSSCEMTLQQLDRWRLLGIIISASHRLALMSDAHQQSLRVVPGEVLMAGVKVLAINRGSISVSLSEMCDGAYYHWYLSGGKNDKESHHPTAVMPADDVFGKSSHHADR